MILGVLSMEGLDRCVSECPENRVDTSLVARPLRLEPLENVLIDPKRDGCLGRERLQPAPDNASNNVLDLSFGMLGAWLAWRRGSTEASPVSVGLH